MTFNTGNPVGSTDARDLYDNAQNLDKFANGQDLEYPDRLGVPRKSLAGIRQDVQGALSRLGYQVKGDYAAGLLIENYGEVFRKDGEFYRAKAETTLPYPLNGDWAVDAPKFVSVGDAVLRQDLSGSAGGGMVGWVRSPLSSAISAVGQMLSAQAVNVWEYAAAVTDKPTALDPSTWDWSPAIQAAHDAGVVALAFGAGTFHVKTVSITHDFELFGLGTATKFKRPAGYSPNNVSMSMPGSTMFDVAASGIRVKVRHCLIDGNEQNQPVSNPSDTLVRCYALTGADTASTHVDIESVTFINQTQSSVHFRGTDGNNQLLHLRVNNCSFIDGRHGLGSDDPSSANVQGFVPIYVDLLDRVEAQITGNVFAFRKAVSTGLYAPSAIRQTVSETYGDTDSPSANIVGNFFYKCGRSDELWDGTGRGNNGIGVIDLYARGRDTTITGNRFFRSYQSSIRGKVNSDNLTITANVIRGGFNPINIGPTTRTAQMGNIVVSGNSIKGADGRAISVVGDTSNGPGYVQNVAITGNMIDGVVNTLGEVAGLVAGIFVRNARDVSVTGNSVMNCTGVNVDGILLRDIAAAAVAANTVRAVAGRGIYLRNSGGTGSVSANVVSGAGNMGIQIDGGSSHTSVTGNQVDGAVDYGIAVLAGTTAEIQGNSTRGISGLSRGYFLPSTITQAMVSGNYTDATTPLVKSNTDGKVTEAGNSWNPTISYGSAAPTAGTWKRNDIVYSSAAAASGVIGWVCVTAGTPGTWKSFGAIAA